MKYLAQQQTSYSIIKTSFPITPANALEISCTIKDLSIKRKLMQIQGDRGIAPTTWTLQ
jgi:hypothetical protein